jgi:hypothetical protein
MTDGGAKPWSAWLSVGDRRRSGRFQGWILIEVLGLVRRPAPIRMTAHSHD